MTGFPASFLLHRRFFLKSAPTARACSRDGGIMALHSSLSEALMLQPRVLAALLAYLERRNASQDQIQKYIRYWRSSPRDPSVPCPNCYSFRGRHSGLTALNDKHGYMDGNE